MNPRRTEPPVTVFETLLVSLNHAVYVYHVGNLLFAANGKPPHPTKRITAIAVYNPTLFHDPKAASYAGFFILSSPNC